MISIERASKTVLEAYVHNLKQHPNTVHTDYVVSFDARTSWTTSESHGCIDTLSVSLSTGWASKLNITIVIVLPQARRRILVSMS